MGVSVIYHDGRVMLCVGPCASFLDVEACSGCMSVKDWKLCLPNAVRVCAGVTPTLAEVKRFLLGQDVPSMLRRLRIFQGMGFLSAV